jgi:REP element-mobilizing transposase RayT
MAVFGFVIMPNHVHFIWQMNKRNGKEKPFGSFLKYTAHQFKKVIKPSELENHKLNAANKSYEFWQRDSLAIELYSPKVAIKSIKRLGLHNP